MTSVYAHRATADLSARENSLDGVRSAAALGADGVECDVRRTADGILVLHHDIEVGGLGAVSACRRADLPSWIPTLEEVLTLCGDLGLAINVEVKSELEGLAHDPMERCAREAAVVCAAAGQTSPVVVSSFSTSALVAAREASSALPLAWLVANPSATARPPWRDGVLATLVLEGVHPFDRIVDADYVARAHEDGLAVRVWTVDEPARIAQLARLGVEAVITDDVPAARRALQLL